MDIWVKVASRGLEVKTKDIINDLVGIKRNTSKRFVITALTTPVNLGGLGLFPINYTTEIKGEVYDKVDARGKLRWRSYIKRDWPQWLQTMFYRGFRKISDDFRRQESGNVEGRVRVISGLRHGLPMMLRHIGLVLGYGMDITVYNLDQRALPAIKVRVPRHAKFGHTRVKGLLKGCDTVQAIRELSEVFLQSQEVSMMQLGNDLSLVTSRTSHRLAVELVSTGEGAEPQPPLGPVLDYGEVFGPYIARQLSRMTMMYTHYSGRLSKKEIISSGLMAEYIAWHSR